MTGCCSQLFSSVPLAGTASATTWRRPIDIFVEDDMKIDMHHIYEELLVALDALDDGETEWAFRVIDELAGEVSFAIHPSVTVEIAANDNEPQ